MNQDNRSTFSFSILIMVIAFSTTTVANADENEGSNKSPIKESINRDLVKVAAVQISGYDKSDLPRKNYDPAALMIPYIDRAGKDKSQLVVFPEYVLGRISVPGPETKRIAAAAKANSIYVVVGCGEVFKDGKYANSALIFDRAGKIMGKYNKTHAAVDNHQGDPPWTKPLKGKSRDWLIRNDPEWTMEAGKSLPVFDFDFGRVGIMTCYDGWFPEPARVLSLRGAELILWINGRGGSVEDFIVKTTIFQSHVAMITTNQAYGSGTMIADVSSLRGPMIARTPPKEEAYISGTINLERIRAIRSNSRNFAQRRPDIYTDLVAPKAPTSQEGAAQVETKIAE
jgi:predicted amidohydrolase